MLEKLKELIEQWTRAEIMARHAPFSLSVAADYFNIKIQKENEIRKLLFDNDNLVELGLKWNILKSETEQVKLDLKEQYLLLQKQLVELENTNA